MSVVAASASAVTALQRLEAFETPEHRAKYPELYEDEHLLEEGRLSSDELFWRDHYSWLKDQGYLLRPRYSPDWSAPWLENNKIPTTFEDSVTPPSTLLIDATRIADGSYVVIKRGDRLDSSASGGSREASIFQMLSSEPLASDPKNHCIPLIEVLRVPDDNTLDLIVMPLLSNWQFTTDLRSPFLTIGEAVEFFAQIFEGLQFMHNNRVWHGDCKANSVLMDAGPVSRDVSHPWDAFMTRDFSRRVRPLRNRTRHPVRYYWMDFDLSGVHDTSDGPPAVEPGYGGIRNVPEFAFKDQKCNPFAVDVWCLGFMIQAYFTQGSEYYGTPKYRGFEFMNGLLAAMVHDDPAQRPSMDDVVREFSQIKAGLSGWKLRSPVVTDPGHIGVLQSTIHWVRQLYLIARHIPAIPTP